MLSFPVSSFECCLFRLVLAKFDDYLSLYGVLGIRRVVMWFPLVFIGIPWVFCMSLKEAAILSADRYGIFLGSPTNCRNIPADNPKRKRGAESYMLSTPRLCKGLGFVEEVLVNPLEGVGPFHLHADTVLHHKTG